jgi:hypothetical protein
MVAVYHWLVKKKKSIITMDNAIKFRFVAPYPNPMASICYQPVKRFCECSKNG